MSSENSRGLTAPGANSRNPRTFRGPLAPGYCHIAFLGVNKPSVALIQVATTSSINPGQEN